MIEDRKAPYSKWWSEESTGLAVKLWMGGKSASEIAKELGKLGIKKTRNAVIGRIHRLGFASNPDRQIQTTIAQNKNRAKKARVSATNQAKGALARRYNADLRGSEPKYTPKPLPDIESPNARPWALRKAGECSWPIGERHETKSCCNPIVRGSFCEDHAAIGYQEPAPTKDLMRLAKRFG